MLRALFNRGVRSAVTSGVSFIVGFALLAASQAAVAGKDDRKLDIYWVDVEGGGATLIVTPEGESVLIDAGNPGRRDPDRIVQVATRVANLTRLDHLVTTHYHVDHFGGAATLATMLPIGEVHDNGAFDGLREPPSEEYKTFKAERRSVISPGDLLPLHSAATSDRPSVRIECLAARQKFAELPVGKREANPACENVKSKPIDNSDNANSVVLLVSFGPFRFLDTGDLTWNREHDLVCPTNRVGKVDVYQVAHHGLDASNNPALIESIAPTVAVMNNGVTKGCEPATFATLKAAKSIEAIYQLHKNQRPDGATSNAPDETIANLDKDCKAAYIKLSVEPDGKSYTISIPAKNNSRTFKTRE